jgi:hypothetical protein
MEMADIRRPPPLCRDSPRRGAVSHPMAVTPNRMEIRSDTQGHFRSCASVPIRSLSGPVTAAAGQAQVRVSLPGTTRSLVTTGAVDAAKPPLAGPSLG